MINLGFFLRYFVNRVPVLECCGELYAYDLVDASGYSTACLRCLATRSLNNKYNHNSNNCLS